MMYGPPRRMRIQAQGSSTWTGCLLRCALGACMPDKPLQLPHVVVLATCGRVKQAVFCGCLGSWEMSTAQEMLQCCFCCSPSLHSERAAAHCSLHLPAALQIVRNFDLDEMYLAEAANTSGAPAEYAMQAQAYLLASSILRMLNFRHK